MSVDELVEKNISLAWFFAHKKNWGDPDEALSIAMAGLLDAAERWKPESGLPFGTYASIRIKFAFGDSYKKARALKRGFEATHVFIDDELSDRLADPNQVGDAYQDERGFLPEIMELIDQLPEERRRILRMRFGFDGPVQTLKEIGTKMGVTGERVRQISNAALNQLSFQVRGQKAEILGPKDIYASPNLAAQRQKARDYYYAVTKPKKDAVKRAEAVS